MGCLPMDIIDGDHHEGKPSLFEGLAHVRTIVVQIIDSSLNGRICRQELLSDWVMGLWGNFSILSHATIPDSRAMKSGQQEGQLVQVLQLFLGE